MYIHFWTYLMSINLRKEVLDERYGYPQNTCVIPCIEFAQSSFISGESQI